MSLPPWFTKVRFWSDAIYKWAREVPGCYWDKADKTMVIPIEVLPMLQKKADALGVRITVVSLPAGGRESDTSGSTK